ncbi:hypothetical protein [Pseudomonas fluorescens]|uniref:Uncharacterized protein n=1 Tax=Pseudomonas fluorescens TaxID=294 RepID=A0A5E7C3B4_PSEFL|nr:hypothetical protein [Pseudomonas fluorescens]VVN98540.1 hypothetical protein PS723_02452 [Pseudomonas fluorescens]
MSAFSVINAFKSRSKSIARQRGQQLSIVREQLSKLAGFSSYHELHRVAETHPEDVRLLRSVFGVSQFNDVVFKTQVLQALERELVPLVIQEKSVPASVTLSMSNLGKVNYVYQVDTGVLLVSVSADCKGLEKFPQGESLHWYSASFRFEVKYRDNRWSLVPNSIGIHLVIDQDETEEDDENFIVEFPPTAFYN